MFENLSWWHWAIIGYVSFLILLVFLVLRKQWDYICDGMSRTPVPPTAAEMRADRQLAERAGMVYKARRQRFKKVKLWFPRS
jgi:hypothetical protein